MNKIKKIAVGIGIYISGLAKKVFAYELSTPTPMYGVSPGPKQTVLETILKIGKIVVPIILFVIGLFVMLREKTTKKVKIIVVSTLVILAIISIILINYLNSMIYSIY
jgi:hypothetical protein